MYLRIALCRLKDCFRIPDIVSGTEPLAAPSPAELS